MRGVMRITDTLGGQLVTAFAFEVRGGARQKRGGHVNRLGSYLTGRALRSAVQSSSATLTRYLLYVTISCT